MALQRHLQIVKWRQTTKLVAVRFCATEIAKVKPTKEAELGVTRPFEEMPGPKGLPFFGSLFEFIKDGGIANLHNASKARFEKYGPIYKFRLFGETSVYLSNALEAEKFVRADGKYPFRPALEPVLHARQEERLPPGFSLMQGEEWYKHRQATSPRMLRLKSVQQNMDNFNLVTLDLINRLRTMTAVTGKEREMDVQAHLFDWSTESIGSFLFNSRFGLFDANPREDTRQFIHSVNQFLNHLVPELVFSPPFYKLFKTPALKKLIHHQYVFIRYVKKTIEEKLKELNMEMGKEYKEEEIPGAVALSILLSSQDFTIDEIVMDVIELFAAGIDTTAYSTQWLLYNLAKNPDVQEKVYQEVDPILSKDGVLNKENLSKVPYLKACLKESQRLFPIAFVFNRRTREELELCGYKVPAGTIVYIHNFQAGRSEKNFERPHEFRPERWLRGSKEEIHPFAVLPFGFGPRMCIGRRVAETEIFSLVSKLIHTFKLSYNQEDVKTKTKLLMVPDRPIKLTFTDRQ